MGLIVMAALLATLRLFWGRLTGAPMPVRPNPRPGSNRFAAAGALRRSCTGLAGPAGAAATGVAAPAELPVQPARDCDVLVVGAGPTGLMAANLLRRSGVNVRIVDKRLSASVESRAFAVQARTVELFHSLGLADALLARGIVNTGIEFHIGGKRVGGLDFDRSAAPDTPYQFITMVPQCESEEVLLDDLARLGVAVERGVEASALHQTEAGVTVCCKAAGDGPAGETVIRAAYVVGADGAHSIVRKSLGLAFEGAKYEQSFLLADCKVDWALDHGRFRVFMNRDRIGLFLPLRGKNVSRVMATDFSGATQPTMELAELQAAFSEAAKMPLTLSDPVWTTRYRVHHRGVDRYRLGRVFVAGDAAHIHSPAGGQGMNTGLQDAANLAWKLAAVLRSGAGDALLDTYHAERHPVGQDVLRFTDRLFSAAAAQRGWRARVRDAVAAFVVKRATRLPIPHRKSFRKLSEINIHYARGEFVRDDGSEFGRGPRPGHRAPDAAIARHRTVFDLISGYRLHVLALSRKPLTADEITAVREQLDSLCGASESVATHLVARVEARRDPRVEFVDTAQVFDRYGLLSRESQAIYIVRPDGYVAWRAPGLDFGGCEDFLARLFGMAPRVAAAAAQPAAAMPHA